MTTKIGLSGAEATVNDPLRNSEYEQRADQIGGAERALDGTRKRHLVAQKRRWTVTWVLTDAELSALTTELNRQADLSWQPPTGSTFTVQCDNYTVRPYAKAHWILTAVLEEV